MSLYICFCCWPLFLTRPGQASWLIPSLFFLFQLHVSLPFILHLHPKAFEHCVCLSCPPLRCSIMYFHPGPPSFLVFVLFSVLFPLPNKSIFNIFFIFLVLLSSCLPNFTFSFLFPLHCFLYPSPHPHPQKDVFLLPFHLLHFSSSILIYV